MEDSARKEHGPAGRQISEFYELDFDDGELHLHSVRGRAFILPTETWVTLRSELTKTFKEGATPFMLQIGYTLGSSFMEQMKKSDSVVEDVMARIPELAAASGWGKFTITGDVKLGTTLTFSLRNCSFCHRVENAGSPVCDFLVGVINGLCDNLYQKPHEAREDKCIPMNSDACEVRVTESSERSEEKKHWGSYLLFPWLRGPSR